MILIRPAKPSTCNGGSPLPESQGNPVHYNVLIFILPD
jgi:hypothetical protein